MSIGVFEIIILLFLVGFVSVISVAIYFLAKYLTSAGGKTCPYCAEKIKEAAKICRYCQRDVANFEIQNQPPRGLFK